MGSVRRLLLDSLNNSGPEGLSACVKRCINQGRRPAWHEDSGISTPADLRLLSERTIQHVDRLSLPHAASLLHSFSIPIYRNFQLFSSLAGRILRLARLEAPSLEDSVRVVSSCGRLHYSDSQLLPVLLKVIAAELDSLRAKHLVAVLHSLTKLRYSDRDLLCTLSLAASSRLAELSEIALANFSIASSKVFRAEFAEEPGMLERGTRVVAALLPELTSRAPASSSLDNLRHVIALSNLAHLAPDQVDLYDCLDRLLKFLNCSVLYYEHLLVLLECLVSLGRASHEFVLNALVPSLLNKRSESTPPEADLRLLNALSALGTLNKICEFLLECALLSLCRSLERHPHLAGHTFALVNALGADPDPFLSRLDAHLREGALDSVALGHVRASIARSTNDWLQLQEKLSCK